MKHVALTIMLLPVLAAAQFIGYTAPQSVQMTNTQLFGTATINSAVTSAAVTNVGNTVHYFEYTCNASVTRFEAAIIASATGAVGSYVRVSNSSYNINSGGLTAYIYLPFVKIQIFFFTSIGGAGTCTISYTGTSVSATQLNGVFARTGANTLAWNVDTTLATYSYTFQPNTGRTSGTLWFQYVGGTGTCTNLTLALDAYPNGVSAVSPDQVRLLPANFSGGGGSGGLPSGVIVLGTGAPAQPFFIPDMAATDMVVSVATNGSCGLGTPLFNIWFSPQTLGNVAYGFSGSQAVPFYACPLHTFVNVAAAGDTQLVAAVTGKTIVVCGLSFASAAAENIKVTYGTGANCVTGNTDATALWINVQFTTTPVFNSAFPLILPISKAMCFNQSAAQATGVDVFYAQF